MNTTTKAPQAAEFDMWRSRIPGRRDEGILGMIRVTRALAPMLDDLYDEDVLDGSYRTWLWFADRQGYRAAHRLARAIAKAGVGGATLADLGFQVSAIISMPHFGASFDQHRHDSGTVFVEIHGEQGVVGHIGLTHFNEEIAA